MLNEQGSPREADERAARRRPPIDQLLGSAMAVATAIEIGLLDVLRSGPATVEQLAARLDCDGRALERLLAVLRELELTSVESGSHAIRDELLAERDGLAALGLQLSIWSALPRFVRSGRSWLHPDDAEARDDVYPHVVLRLGSAFAAAATDLASRLDPADGEILDVGAGSGVWSLTMAERSTTARVVALDGPSTLRVFRGEAQRRGLSARTDTLAGDYHSVELPRARYARAVLANVLHLERPQRAASLVRRVAGSLAPGGELVVVDCVADPQPRDGLTVAIYAMHLALRVAQSQLYRRVDLERWATESGLSEQRWIGLGNGLFALVAR